MKPISEVATSTKCKQLELVKSVKNAVRNQKQLLLSAKHLKR